MTRRSWRAAALLLALSWCVPAAAQQQRTGTFEASLFGGWNDGGTLSAGSTGIFVRDVSVVGNGTYGVRAGTFFTRGFGLELSYERTSSIVRNRFGTKIGDIDAGQWDIGALFNLTRGRVVPYLVLGLGVSTLSVDAFGRTGVRSTQFAASTGLGLKWFLSPKLAMRMDGRWHGAYTGTTKYCAETEGCTVSWYHSVQGTAGLTAGF
jgi:hypothetical protein